MKKWFGVLALCVLTSGLTGCIGRSGLTSNVRDWNLEVTEDPWGREAIWLLTLPVRYVTQWLDLIIFNSVEFWTGTNPITGESPRLADVKVSALEEKGVLNVASAHLRFEPERVQLDVLYRDGTYETFDVERADDGVHLLRGGDVALAFERGELRAALR